MTGKLKIKQLAELTQLSTSTVSRVLSGKSNVSPQAKEKVFTHAKLLGILHNIPAGRLLMNSILVCAPAKAFTPHGDRYYYEIIQSIISKSNITTSDSVNAAWRSMGLIFHHL